MVRNTEQKIISQARQSGARGVEMLRRRLHHRRRISDRLFNDMFNLVHSEKLRKHRSRNLQGNRGADYVSLT